MELPYQTDEDYYLWNHVGVTMTYAQRIGDSGVHTNSSSSVGYHLFPFIHVKHALFVVCESMGTRPVLFLSFCCFLVYCCRRWGPPTVWS